MLPALCVDGYIACNVYRGGVTKELFESFILDDVLPKCGRYPGPKSIIVMDNAKIHCDNTDSLTVLPLNAETHLEYQRCHQGTWMQTRIPPSLLSRLQSNRILLLRH